MKVDLDAALDVVRLVSEFASKRDIVPALTYLFAGDGQIRSFSGEAGAVWQAPWADEEVAVPARMLARVLSSLLNQGQKTTELSVGKQRLTVMGQGGFKGMLPVLTADVDPEIKKGLTRVPPKGGAKLTETFWEGVAKCEPSISKDATRPAMCGVCWTPEGAFMSTDNYRMTAVYPAKPIKCPDKTGIVIPGYLLALMVSHRKELTRAVREGEGEQGTLWFAGDSGAINGAMLQGVFPFEGMGNWLKQSRETAENEGTWYTLKGGQPIEQIIDRLLLFASDELTYQLKVEPLKNSVRLMIEEENGSGFSAEEKVPVEKYEGEEPETFYVNAKYFRDAVAISPRFWVKPGSPLFVRSTSKEAGTVEHQLTLLANPQP